MAKENDTGAADKEAARPPVTESGQPDATTVKAQQRFERADRLAAAMRENLKRRKARGKQD